MVNAQKWLYNHEKYNTPEKREKVENLDISNQNLEGKIILAGFKNLERLNCSHNQLTSLDLTDSSKSLKELIVNDNQLSRLIFDTSDPTNLKTLNLANNKFHNNHSFWNFTFLFCNLESLDLRNSGVKKELVDYVGYVKDVELDEKEKWGGKTFKLKSFGDYLGENYGNSKNISEYEKEELRKKYRNAQEWLNFNYPKEQRNKVKEVIINGELAINNDKSMELEGELDLRDFTSLEN